MNRFLINILIALFVTIGSVICRAADGNIAEDAERLSTVRVRIAVTDSLSGQPIPYVAIMLHGNQGGVLANEKGLATVFVNPSTRNAIEVQTMGYSTKIVEIPKGKKSISVALVPTGVKLKEVIVKRTKEKYSKKNNPAVKFAESIKRTRDLTDPRRHDNYNYDKYERITMAINQFDEGQQENWLFNKFPFLNEHVDTSEVSGQPILNLSVREKTSQVSYRRDPESEKEYVTGRRHEGIDDLMSNQENIQEALEDVFREVDLYKNDITVLQNRFVSPLSRIASDFYKFYLTDTVDVEGERCIVLSFAPHNPQAFGFIGRVYVPEGDSTMFIKKVEMNVPRDINLNFIQKMYINQQFERASDGSRLKTKDDMIVEVLVLPGTPGLYFRRNTAYRNHNFELADRQALFDKSERSIVDSAADLRDETFWASERQFDITDNELRVGSMMERLRSVPVYYWSERTLKLLMSGYIHTGKKNLVDLGPIGKFISGNTIEGLRMQLGGLTTANLSKRWFAKGYAAYGLKDKRFKYSGELEYSFIDKKYHAREFPIKSIKVRHSYDVDEIGQGSSYYSNMDMIFSSFTRMDNNQMTYKRESELEYVLELANHFSIETGLKYTRQEATPLMPFISGDGHSYWKYDQATFNVKLRYAPGEKFYQGKSERQPINLDAPVFTLSHSFGPMNFLGSQWTINKTEASVFKRFWFSAFGYADVVVKGGHVWNQAPYPNLLIPTANISYLIQPETFALLNPLEFITDTYGVWDLTYWANGAIFNYIPFLKKLKLREVISFRGFVGHLSMKNDPKFHNNLYRFPEISNTQRLGSTPYMEVAVGLDNVFRIFRVDYVWRLTYRDAPGIDRTGLRMSFHFTF